MGFLRRKRLPEGLAAFFAAFRDAERDVEDAQAVLARAAPTTRLPGMPLAEVLADFDRHLTIASDAMAGWRCPEIEHSWLACRDGLDRARAMGERVRLDASEPPGFEALIGLLDALSAPLEVFEDAERAFRALRR